MILFMNEVLINAIRVIEGLTPTLNNFTPNYLFATENISGITKKISFKEKTILTVCSSGDQAFNMIVNDCENVDLFDINIFSEYFFYLKLAAIKSLDYEDFLSFLVPKNIFVKSSVFSLETYLKIRNKIENNEIRYFWDYIFCHYPEETIYNSEFFFKSKHNIDDYKECNDYLKNENNYNKLKENLKKKNFNFYNLDLFSDKLPNNSQYDFIYLSNIFDYLPIKNNMEFLEKMREIILKVKNNLTSSGMIGVSYLYFYFDDYIFQDYVNIFKLNQIENENFGEFHYIDFPSFFLPKSRQKRNNDALILYKKTE